MDHETLSEDGPSPLCNWTSTFYRVHSHTQSK